MFIGWCVGFWLDWCVVVLLDSWILLIVIVWCFFECCWCKCLLCECFFCFVVGSVFWGFLNFVGFWGGFGLRVFWRCWVILFCYYIEIYWYVNVGVSCLYGGICCWLVWNRWVLFMGCSDFYWIVVCVIVNYVVFMNLVLIFWFLLIVSLLIVGVIVCMCIWCIVKVFGCGVLWDGVYLLFVYVE